METIILAGIAGVFLFLSIICIIKISQKPKFIRIKSTLFHIDEITHIALDDANLSNIYVGLKNGSTITIIVNENEARPLLNTLVNKIS